MRDISQVTFRLTDENDFDAIKSIQTGLPPEFDYIRERYPTLVKDPLFYGAIGEIKGEVIALSVGFIQMEGTKIYNRSDRVKQEWRNKGILRSLKNFLRETLRERYYPRLCVEEFVTHDTNFAIQKLFENSNYEEIYRNSFVTIEASAASLSEHTFSSNVRDIGIQGLRKILESDSLRSRLFPTRVSVGFMAFEPAVSEIGLIKKQKPFVLASFGRHEQDIQQLTIGARESSGAFVVTWFVDDTIFTQQSQQDLSTHLMRQLKKMFELNNGGKCVVFLEKAYTPMVREELTKLGCKEIKTMATEFIGFRREF